MIFYNEDNQLIPMIFLLLLLVISFILINLGQNYIWLNKQR